jgi:hypothetical protein
LRSSFWSSWACFSLVPVDRVGYPRRGHSGDAAACTSGQRGRQQLVSGGVGGNIAGSLLKQFDLGVVGNTIAGVIGGGVGAQIIGQLLGGGTEAAAGAGGLDIGSIIGQIASGGVGGGILMVIVGLIKQAMGGQKVG